MNIHNKLVGKGIKFPIVPTMNKGLATSELIDRINQSLFILFNTNKGSRLLMPEFGSSIRKYRFDPFDDILISRLRETLLGDIKRWEPRIIVENILFYEDSQAIDSHILYIEVRYLIINTEVRGNFVYPYQREVYDIFAE